jgi:ANTAR domain
MNDIIDSDPAEPGDLIRHATAIIMDRFGLDAVRALEVLRKMSQNTRTQMCVVAEQVINHHVPVAAIRGLEEAVRDFG